MRLAIHGLIVALVALCGCQGSHARIGFDTTNVPLSMSGALVDEAGEVIDSDNFVVISRFETDEKRSWSMFYTAAVIQKSVDFSEEINAAVAAAKGEAVVNLTVKSRICGMNYVFPLTILPFWAGCVRIWVSGDIITREGVAQRPAVEPAAEAPPPADEKAGGLPSSPTELPPESEEIDPAADPSSDINSREGA